MPQLLTGLRVAEVSAFVAAPLCGMTLAQMGADIVQINPISGRMDGHRWPHAPSGTSLYYAALNKGKRSIRLDLRSDRGREIAARLMAGTPGDGGGIVVSNLPLKDAMHPDTLRKTRPDLISLQLTGNPDGSPALDYTVNCASGFPYITGTGDKPINNAVPVWDIATGMYLALGVVAADRHRRATGQGQSITIALSDVMLATVGNLGFLSEAQVNADPRPRLGNQVFGAFGQDFVTRDGRSIMITGISDKQWAALVAATGLGEAMQNLETEPDVTLADEFGRYRARDRIAAILAPWVAARTLAEIRSIFDGKGILWGPFQTFDQLVAEDPRSTLANPLMQEIHQPGIGRHLAPGLPLMFGADTPPELRRAPLMGEHTEAILADLLGMGSGEIGTLFDAGIVAGPDPT